MFLTAGPLAPAPALRFSKKPSPSRVNEEDVVQHGFGLLFALFSIQV